MNIITQDEIDALVDGELNDTYRYDLLQRIEQEPEQWRRVALAFLEAQSIQTALRTPSKEIAPPKVIQPAAPPTTVRNRFSWRDFAILACSMLASLLLGYVFAHHQAGVIEPTPSNLAVATAPQSPTIQPASTQQPLMLARSLSPEAKLELEKQGFLVQELPRLVHVEVQGRSGRVYYHQVTLRYFSKVTIL